MEELNKEKIEKIMRTPGETRGFNVKHDGEYILRVEGEHGLEKLEKELKDMGHELKYKKIADMSFLPAGLRALSLLAIKGTYAPTIQRPL